jgi:hypothetical protein
MSPGNPISIPPKQAEISGCLFKQLLHLKGIIIIFSFTVLFKPHSVEIYIKHREITFLTALGLKQIKNNLCIYYNLR